MLTSRGKTAPWARTSKKLKQRLSLLDYLRQQSWTARPIAFRPRIRWNSVHLHTETRRLQFYVNVRKNLFYCHGCGQGGDLIRFVQLSRHLFPFAKVSLTSSSKVLSQPTLAAVLERAATFYQQQLERYPEALRYLRQRGLQDPSLIKKLRIGLRSWRELGVVISWRKAIPSIFCSVSACSTHKAATLSTSASSSRAAKADASSTSTAAVSRPAFAHQFLPGSKGGFVRLGIVRQFPTVILVEGLFDFAGVVADGFSPRHLFVGHPSQCGTVSTAVRPSAHRLSHLRCRRQRQWPKRPRSS